jgi:hypothetical protein
MCAIKIVMTVVAVVAGLVGATFWWIGSTREKHNMEAFIHWKLVQDEHGRFSHHQDTYPFLERIGWWNKWAAVATAISVIASTAANVVPG